MVESALILVLFLILFIAVFDFAQFLFVHQALVERTRAAARWGAIQDPADSTSITNMVLYNQAVTPPPGTPTYFNLSPSNIVVTNPDAGTDNYRLNVRISGYRFTILSPFIAGSFTGPTILVSTPLGLYN